MSTFLRSSNGINNLHLFYNVTYTVYLEGGVSITKNEAFQGQFTDETEDILFWSTVFKTFKNETTFQFKSVGSKTTIKEIAADITDGSLNTVLVAMDNEFDELMKTRVDHPHIFYTHGYSWENDVWNIETINYVIRNLTALSPNQNPQQEYYKFLKDIRLGVFADGYLFKKGSSFFNRSKGRLFCVDCNPTYLPSVKTDVINLKIQNLNLNINTIKSFGYKHKINAQKLCYGHLLADYSCQLISYYISKKHKLPKMPNDILNRIALNYFKNNFDNYEHYNYFSQQLSRLI